MATFDPRENVGAFAFNPAYPDVVINGVTYTPKYPVSSFPTPDPELLKPPRPEPEDDRPEKPCFEALDDFEKTNAPKGTSLESRARRVLLRQAIEKVKAELGGPKHVCEEPWDDCLWNDEAVDDFISQNRDWDVEYTTFVPRSQPGALVLEALGFSGWKEMVNAYGSHRDYLAGVLKSYVDLDRVVELSTNVARVSEGDEFLGWLISDE